MTEKLYIAKVKYGMFSFVVADIVRKTPKGFRIENIVAKRGNLYISSLVMTDSNQYTLFQSLPDALTYVRDGLNATLIIRYQQIAETEEELSQVADMMDEVKQAAHDAKFFPTD